MDSRAKGAIGGVVGCSILLHLAKFGWKDVVLFEPTGAWSLDCRPDFTAAQSGLDAFIDWSKNFIGKDAAAGEPTRSWSS